MSDLMPSHPVALFERATTDAARVMAAIRPDQLALDTPCTAWTVQQLIDHMVGGPAYLIASIEGRSPEPPVGATVSDYRERVTRVLAMLQPDGVLVRECPSPLGFTWTIEQAVAGTFMDQLVHTWDLAAATGQDRTLDPHLVERCTAMFLPQMPEMGRAGGLIGPAVPVPQDASVQDRLLGALGRQP